MLSEPCCVSTATQSLGGWPQLTHLRGPLSGKHLPLLDNMKGVVGLSQVSEDHGRDLVHGFHSTSP